MPVRVLIVDDDGTFRESARLVLERQGFAVAGEAGSVAGARDAMAAIRPAAVLLDVHLPDGDGLSLTEELGAAIRVLLTSSDAHAAPAGVVARVGAAGFVPKTELAVTDLRGFLGG